MQPAAVLPFFFLSFMTTCPLSVLFKERVSTVLKNVNVVVKDYLSVKMVFSGLSPFPGFSKEVALRLIDSLDSTTPSYFPFLRMCLI